MKVGTVIAGFFHNGTGERYRILGRPFRRKNGHTYQRVRKMIGNRAEFRSAKGFEGYPFARIPGFWVAL